MILSFDALAQYRGLVTMVDGGFDPLHPGHLAYFRAARSFGAPLLCNLCPDTYTATKHPILLPAADRAQILDALDLITYVHVSDRPTAEVLAQLQPRYYAKGDDWKDRLPADHLAACATHGTQIVFTGPTKGSSTALIKALQPDVDAFERLVQGQTPAREPWTPTEAVPYDFESRKMAEGQHPQLIKDVFQPKAVLDVGCGPGHLVRLLRELDVRAIGADSHFSADYWIDITEPGLDASQAQLVICREVLEHLTIRGIRHAVTNLCALSSKYVYVTTRFAKAPQHFLSVDTTDDLDPTHITMLNQDFLRTLFVLEGFRRRADLEQRLDWQNKGRVLVYERAA